MVNVGKTKQESLPEGGFFFPVFYLISKNSGKLQSCKNKPGGKIEIRNMRLNATSSKRCMYKSHVIVTQTFNNTSEKINADENRRFRLEEPGPETHHNRILPSSCPVAMQSSFG